MRGARRKEKELMVYYCFVAVLSNNVFLHIFFQFNVLNLRVHLFVLLFFFVKFWKSSVTDWDTFFSVIPQFE